MNLCSIYRQISQLQTVHHSSIPIECKSPYWDKCDLRDDPYTDNAFDRFDFTKTMFLGQERELLLLNVLTYTIFDLWFGSTAVSICCCYLLDWGIAKIRERYGQVMHLHTIYK